MNINSVVKLWTCDLLSQPNSSPSPNANPRVWFSGERSILFLWALSTGTIERWWAIQIMWDASLSSGSYVLPIVGWSIQTLHVWVGWTKSFSGMLPSIGEIDEPLRVSNNTSKAYMIKVRKNSRINIAFHLDFRRVTPMRAFAPAGGMGEVFILGLCLWFGIVRWILDFFRWSRNCNLSILNMKASTANQGKVRRSKFSR